MSQFKVKKPITH